MATDSETPTKRKRDIIPENEDDKIAIDIDLPEPPSKKAKRKEKKQAKRPGAGRAGTSGKEESIDEDVEGEVSGDAIQAAATEPTKAAKRGDHGIWIGNLPFNVNKIALRKFLKDQGGIDEQDITRVHMPAGPKVNNKGFAYVDFTTDAVLQIALALNERLLNGRAVLIKNAKSFEGRPEKSASAIEEAKAGASNKPESSKRVFVGNLSFDVTQEDLTEHFQRAGKVDDVFMATFQDSGKCKGFAWVRFAEIEAAESAVRGYVLKQPDEDEISEESDAEANEAKCAETKKGKEKKARRYYINRIKGRQIRCEFAEDSQTRYKKRFGKGAGKDGKASDNSAEQNGEDPRAGARAGAGRASSPKRPDRNLSKDERQEMRRKRHDARMIAPGKALASAQRATGAIVAAAGIRTTFDE